MPRYDDEYWAKQRERRAHIEKLIAEAIGYCKGDNLQLAAQRIADVLEMHAGYSKDYGKVPDWFNRAREIDGLEPLD